MPEVVNTTFLGSSIDDVVNTSDETMIKVENVSMVFNMASEALNNLKEYAIALVRGELRFKEFRALNDISLEVKRGDVFGILGTNGSGKSTLLKIVAGVLDPTEGSTEIYGSIAPLIELGAGFDLELTARENIYLNGALLGYSKEFINGHFQEIVDFAEVEKFLDMPMKNYSSGMVARVAFAIATAIVPDILIVDEVLSVGDFMFRQKCERRINSLIKDHGVTVLIVSHDNHLIERLCNKAVWIEKGHLRMIGASAEVCETYRVLGGHVGSLESEKKVFALLEDKEPVDETLSETFMGDNRYSVSVKVYEQVAQSYSSDTIIIAPGEKPAACILANSYASLINAPILLTQSDRLPDLVGHQLAQIQPKKIVVLGDEAFIEKSVLDEIRTLCPSADIDVLESGIEERIAPLVYAKGGADNWGKKAVLTYPDGLGDMLCFLPYIVKQNAPVFYNFDQGKIRSDVIELLSSGKFEEILVLGGQKSFPDKCLQPFEKAGVKVTRFCGKDPFDANDIIDTWIENETPEAEAADEAFMVSIWSPYDALTIGPLIKQRNGIVRVEDGQDLDSIANNTEFIEARAKQFDKVVFVGDETQFSKLKKTLLVKAFQKAKRKA